MKKIILGLAVGAASVIAAALIADKVASCRNILIDEDDEDDSSEDEEKAS